MPVLRCNPDTIPTSLKEAVADLQNLGFFPGGPVRRPGEAFEIALTEGQ